MTDHQADRALVVGLGNPILGDDGIGWRVAEALERRLAGDAAAQRTVGPVEIDTLSVGGLRLMERLVGYHRVVIVDACLDGRAPGTVHARALCELQGHLAGHLDSAHDVTLSCALAAAGALGATVPDDLAVVTVSAERVHEFGEQMSPPVAAAVEPAVDAVIQLLAQGHAAGV